MSLNDKKADSTSSMTLGALFFFIHVHVLCDGPLVDGKTTPISKSLCYTYI